ncbi:hypothetical protein ACP275_11G112400 [Erythranthe tilingii]
MCSGVLRNRLFVGIIVVTVVLQAVMVELLKKFADTVRLSFAEWGVCVAIAAVTWPIGWVVKFVPVGKKPVFSYLKLLRCGSKTTRLIPPPGLVGTVDCRGM